MNEKHRTGEREPLILGETDVLLGRGNGVAHHPGNYKFRSIITYFKPIYAESSRNEKRSVAERVLKEISKLSPPGRFLEPSSDKHKSYIEIKFERALEKTCQALREKKSPVVRRTSKKKVPHTAVIDLSLKATKRTIVKKRGMHRRVVSKQSHQGISTPGANPSADFDDNRMIDEIACNLTVQCDPGLVSFDSLLTSHSMLSQHRRVKGNPPNRSTEALEHLAVGGDLVDVLDFEYTDPLVHENGLSSFFAQENDTEVVSIDSSNDLATLDEFFGSVNEPPFAIFYDNEDL